MSVVKLSTMGPGQSGVIAALHAEDELYHRLAEMGFRVGNRIEILRLGRFSGPLHLRIGTTDLMLRRSDAQKIDIAAA
ncbi:MAG: ferrous iron transport protein A [Burkholderiales bacterium]|nr:ferrous iron transport protein A [Burkholderiales bacterium]